MDQSIRPRTVKEQAQFAAISEHVIAAAADDGAGEGANPFDIGTRAHAAWADAYRAAADAGEDVCV